MSEIKRWRVRAGAMHEPHSDCEVVGCVDVVDAADHDAEVARLRGVREAAQELIEYENIGALT